MSSDPDARTTLPKDWSYVSEGGATIVFSYTGPPHPLFSRTVLRLRKAVVQPPPRPIVKPLDIAEQWERQREDELEEEARRSRVALNVISDPASEDEEDEEEPDDPTIEFQDRITSRLIPPIHLPRLEPARVDRPWLEELHKRAEPHRPAERREKDAIDLNKTKAVLATDLVGGKGMAVEIKPKWAFLPNPTHLSDETKNIKVNHCRFCMHSHQKVSTGGTSALGYCPLDLFSRDKTRIRRAVGALWDSWVSSNGTVNNLKIFVDGKTILPKDAAAIAPHVESTATASLTLSSLRGPFIETVLPLLYDTVILETLSTLQRSLDSLDIEGLSKLWELNPGHDHKSTNPLGLESPEPTMEEWAKFADDFLQSNAGRDFDRTYLSKMEVERLRFWMLAYLLSGTFKDCSVILRLGADGEDTITAIDLDPKSVSRLRRWADQDRDIVLAYKKSIERGLITDKAPCVDSGVQMESLPMLEGGRTGQEEDPTSRKKWASCTIG